MNTVDPTCAVCDQPVSPGVAAHAVRDKFVCGACRELVLAAGPRPVLPYAGGGRRRRRLLVAALGLCAALVLALALGVVARQVAVQRAREERMRAVLAQQQALLAAQQSIRARVQAQRATTGPGE